MEFFVVSIIAAAMNIGDRLAVWNPKRLANVCSRGSVGAPEWGPAARLDVLVVFVAVEQGLAHLHCIVQYSTALLCLAYCLQVGSGYAPLFVSVADEELRPNLGDLDLFLGLASLQGST